MAAPRFLICDSLLLYLGLPADRITLTHSHQKLVHSSLHLGKLELLRGYSDFLASSSCLGRRFVSGVRSCLLVQPIWTGSPMLSHCKDYGSATIPVYGDVCDGYRAFSSFAVPIIANTTSNPSLALFLFHSCCSLPMAAISGSAIYIPPLLNW